MKVLLKSAVIGDRNVTVNVTTKMGVSVRTGDGFGNAVFVVRQFDNYKVKFQRSTGRVWEETFPTRTEALLAAAKFIEVKRCVTRIGD